MDLVHQNRGAGEALAPGTHADREAGRLCHQAVYGVAYPAEAEATNEVSDSEQE
ncbi:hypothetical protein [Streptomyces sp. Ru71]|uniref:hypothetical protein n=1 Tax=Streptomyces sp. Ru71 TaxID=2080746 RepID=UPI0015E48A1E|nr:hypothetical protein [Streptomyces sp. Ru71]